MHNLNPNDMDDLFKEGASQHDFEYNPAAWSMMEDKLDKHDRRRRFMWYILGLAMIASLAGLYLWTSSTGNTERTVPSSQPQSTPVEESTTIAQQSSAKEDTHPVANHIEITQKESETKNNKKNYIREDSKVSSRNIGAQNSFQSENTGSLATSEVVSIPSPTVNNSAANSQEIITTKSRSVTTGQADSPTYAGVNNDRQNIGVVSADERKQERERISFDLLNMPSFALTQEEQEVTIDYDNRVDFEFPDLQSSIKPRFVVTVFGAGELSSVGSISNAGPGYRVGAKAGFQFNQKWQVDLGVAYSHKVYGGLGGEYTPSNGWYSDIEPTWMDAKCNVLEIPLEVTYFPKGYENSGFFFNAGISSYTINDEWYGFKYDTDGMDPQLEQLLVKEIFPEDVSTNYHVIGAGRLSVGYQKILSSKSALEIAPYVQIPLTGLGEGKVNMYSTGIQLGMRWGK